MKTILFLLLLSPFFGFSQNTTVFIKLTDAKGQLIKGESVTKGFEGWITATTFNSAGKNNTQVYFSMSVSGASADFRRAMANGEFLTNGQVSVMGAGSMYGGPSTLYTVKMERISVISCIDAMGCNNVMNTTVTLQATRIGWTYYGTGKTGTQTVTKKFGWNTETNSEWTSF